MCSGAFDSSNCRSQTELCVSSEYEYNMAGAWRVHLGNRTLVQYQTSNNIYPPTLRVGDYNLDTYADFIAVTQLPGDVARVHMWKNLPCDSSICTPEQVANNSRTFVIETSNVDVLTLMSSVTTSPYAAFFLDFDENGIFDIIVMYTDEYGNPLLKAFFNNLYNDAYFFKTMGMYIYVAVTLRFEWVFCRFQRSHFTRHHRKIYSDWY